MIGGGRHIAVHLTLSHGKVMRTSFQSAVAGIALSLLATPALAEACFDAWTETVQPIVNRCVGCHQKASPAAKLNLQKGAAPANLVWVKSEQSDLPLVTPGDLSQSYLWHKLQGTHLEVGGSGVRMPLGGRFDEKSMAAVEAWILGCDIPPPEGMEVPATDAASSSEVSSSEASSEPSSAPSSQPSSEPAPAS